MLPSARLIIGPPGSGKGTQAPMIKDEYCLCHLSTGDMLRAQVKAGTELGKKAEKIMKAGELTGADATLEFQGCMSTPSHKESSAIRIFAP